MPPKTKRSIQAALAAAASVKKRREMKESNMNAIILDNAIDDASSDSDSDSSSDDGDFTRLDDDADVEVASNALEKLKWNSLAEEQVQKCRPPGQSARTMRRQAAQYNTAKFAKGSRTLEEIWGSANTVIQNKERQPMMSGYNEAQLRVVSEQLNSRIKKLRNAREGDREFADISKFDIMRLMAINSYYQAILKGSKKIPASEIVSRAVLNRGQWGARVLRQWANIYFETLTLPLLFQGRHVKVKSLIYHEDVQASCHEYLRNIPPASRTLQAFRQFVNTELLPIYAGLVSNKAGFSDSTLLRWLDVLGYKKKDCHNKGVYEDGHERSDVVQYRKEFCVKMLNFLSRSIQWEEGPNGLMEIRPTLAEGEHELVFVNHDESIFSSNDDKRFVYLEGTEKVLRPKGDGKCLMVSGFACQCHGVFCSKTIAPGKNSDGYWKCEDLVKQCKEALELFDELHPGKAGLFVFDHSLNHLKNPEDGLVVSDSLPSKDNGKNAAFMRDGWYTNSHGEKIIQPMQNHAGQPKGLVTILAERFGRSNVPPHRDCKQRNVPDKSCETFYPYNCCQVNLLRNQPDFKEQKSMLEEVFEGTRHQMILNPKFHCELAWIENVWGDMKRFCREKCEYSFRALRTTVPLALIHVNEESGLVRIKRYQRRCFRLMDAYSKGYSLALAQFASKKFSCHRSIPSDITYNQIEEAYTRENKINRHF